MLEAATVARSPRRCMGLDPSSRGFFVEDRYRPAVRSAQPISSDSFHKFPALPLFGVFKTNSLGGGAYAVNAYLNRYVISRTAAQSGDRFMRRNATRSVSPELIR